MKRFRPLWEAILAGAVIFACFSGSAGWVYFQAKQRELARHRELIEWCARQAALAFDRRLLEEEATGATSPAQRAAVLEKLRAIRAQESAIARIAVVCPAGDDWVVYLDTNPDGLDEVPITTTGPRARLPDEEGSHAKQVRESTRYHSVTRGNGSVKAYAPVVMDGVTVAVATAESAPHALHDGLSALGFAVLSSVALGAMLGVGVGGVVYSLRRKSFRAAERLARVESTDRLVVAALGQVFYEHDLAADVIKWRGSDELIVGGSATGLDWQERIHPEDRSTFREAQRQAQVNGQPFAVEYRLRCANGKFIWLLDRGGFLAAQEDSPPSMIGVVLDITASREAEQRLRDVVDSAGEYIWEVDSAGRYVYVSDRVHEVLGWTPEEMLGHEPFDFVPEEEREEVRRVSETLVENEHWFRDFEHQFLCADGRMIWISVNGIPFYDADGKRIGFRGAGLDITSRKEAEQALIREKEAANAAVRAKSQFLAMMSHEIRTPLNSVLGFADLLAVSDLDREQSEHVEMISRNGDALLALLHDILDFSRLESVNLSLDLANVDVRACFHEVMDLYRPAAANKGVDLLLDLAPEVPATMRTDKARLRQILLNFVGNAVKFTDRGSVRVSVTVAPLAGTEKSVLRIEVRDTGIGIPEEKQDVLFQPFSQVDSSTTRRFGGTGLGLAICKRLAELLSGEVGLMQSGPRGSTFFFTLPVVAPAAENTASAGGGKSRPRTGGMDNGHQDTRILVVEDNRVNRLLVQKMLSSFGFTSEVADDGRQCVDKHAIRPYDVILMDVQMPVLDGLSATRLIREKEAANGAGRTHIIALTADALAGDRERCLDAGMDEYLSKPIRRDALGALLEQFGLLKTQ